MDADRVFTLFSLPPSLPPSRVEVDFAPFSAVIAKLHDARVAGSVGEGREKEGRRKSERKGGRREEDTLTREWNARPTICRKEARI